MNENIPTDLITRRFLNGINLILKYEPEARITIGQHDTFYFGSYDVQMSKEDKELMLSWDWYEEEESWAINV